VEFTKYYVGNQTVDYTIRLPWGDTRQLSLVINDRKTYNDPYSKMIWSIVASEYDTIEDRVNVVCCHEEMQLATHVLTLWFKPWPWTNIDGALAKLSNETLAISGELSNVFSGITGYEYVSHDIVYATPSGSSHPLIGIKIHVYASAPTVQVAPFAVFIVIFAMAAFLSFGNPVAEAWGTILYEAEMYPILIKELEQVGAERDDALFKVIKLEFESGQISDEEVIARMKALVAADKELAEEFLARNGMESHDKYAECANDAKRQYLLDGDINVYLNAMSSCLNTRLVERKEETETNYDDSDLVDLDFTTAFDDMLTYMMYGGMAVGALLLSQIAITTTDTFRR
jgi:hypothetical protein